MSETRKSRVVLYVHELLHSPTADEITVHVHHLFARMGLPEPYPDAERLAIAVLTGIFTLFMYFVLFGKRHRRRRRVLKEELDEAYRKVQELQDRMAQMELEEREAPPKEQIRIWMDGAFDMMHYGHMNAFRQARSLGTYLVVGVNDDESITACKGAPPVLNNDERIASVKGCKFVDEVEPHCPYIMNETYLQRMLKKHRIDYVVHGDDPCIVDGKDVYESAQKLGKYRTIPRTEGVSTSDILGRMLVMHKTHHTHDHFAANGQLSSRMLQDKKAKERPSKFLTTNRMLRLFSVGNHEPQKSDKIVYIDGAFDMFHAGHVEILRLAKQEGSYLVVGVHNDSVVNAHRGLNYPIMNLHERVLSVLGCKYVDDVLIDAPWQVTPEMVASLNISVVVHGTHRDQHHLSAFSLDEHYEHARKVGIFKLIESPLKLDVDDIVARINDNRERFDKKFVSKMKAEQEYYADRYGIKK
uniref:ethanolamine-phosphate cytidylyltransferase n=2 Tax=Hyaloperonospora arabidopsidis (strain Emoy2) TaxID=559515 RepID=M4B8B6_HYAAE